MRREVPTRNGLNVRVTGGFVTGVREGSRLAWRGMPYAAPPVGELRFRAPHPVVPWKGFRDGSKYGNVAPQLHNGQFRGPPPSFSSGEDCLSINVLIAASTRRSQPSLPVMVFIHGGGYSAGSSRDFSGQGESFVRSGQVVYVSFNYRLGALGYLDFTRYSTAERPFDGNLGLRDQVAALEWVRDNIGAFGGDPNNVTVFGESAGGNAVVTLMATPGADGLFARAIAQSPPANAAYPQALADRWAAEFVELLRVAFVLGRAAGAGEVSPSELLASATVSELMAASLVLQIASPDSNPGMFCLAPVVDGVFLPERPIEAFRHGRAQRVPLIIGTNDREGALFIGRLDLLPRTPKRIRALVAQAPPSSHPAMRDAYPGLPARRAAADFGGDFAFWYPAVVVGECHSRAAPVHFYRFDIAPRLMRLVGLDATHGIELFALFDNVNTSVARTATVLGGREDFARAGERMRQYWIQFACDGRVADTWPAFSEPDRMTLIIDQVDRVESDPRRDRRIAWSGFLPEV